MDNGDHETTVVSFLCAIKKTLFMVIYIYMHTVARIVLLASLYV